MPLVVNLNPIGLEAQVAQNVGDFATNQANQEASLRAMQANDAAMALRNNIDVQNRRLDIDQQRVTQAGDLGQQRIDQAPALVAQRAAEATELTNLKNLAASGRLDERGKQRMAELNAKFQANADMEDKKEAFKAALSDRSLQFKADVEDVKQRNAANRVKLSSDASSPEYRNAVASARDDVSYAFRHYSRVAEAADIAQKAYDADIKSPDLAKRVDSLKADLADALKAYQEAVDTAKATRAAGVPVPAQRPAVIPMPAVPPMQIPNVMPPQNLAPQVQQQQATPAPVQQFAPPAGYDPQAIPAEPQQATPATPAPLAPQVVQTLRAITQEVKAAFPGATPQQLRELIKVRMTHAGIDPNALGIQ